MNPKPPPRREDLPPETRAVVDALHEDGAPDPTLDAIHERMRPRVLAMIAQHLDAAEALDAAEDDAAETG